MKIIDKKTGQRKGTVFLVGAGPGDPDLITVRGLDAIKKAEVLVYDRLANPDLLSHAPDKTERIYVGKRPANPLFHKNRSTGFWWQRQMKEN
jgi:uroporphyrin-III C-methyltransferase